MPTLSTLPVELWLEVIDILRPKEIDAPITGVNAGWTKLSGVCPPAPEDTEEIEPWHTANRERRDTIDDHSALANLRLTSKAMNELCTPFLFHSLNLVKQDPDPSLVIPSTYGHHVRSIRILIDPFIDGAPKNEDYSDNVAGLLRACLNVQSIALYYRLGGSSMERVAHEVLELMKDGKVEALGIYSVLVLHQDVGEWYWNRIHPIPPKQLLDQLYLAPQLTRSLRKLDVVTETMTYDSYDAIRMSFPALESLTIRRGIRSYLGRVWDPEQRVRWHSKPNLTHLHIIDCLAGYAPHIPELVRLFAALKFLTISTCGDADDVRPPPRTYGWSSQPDTLCRMKDPLEIFHIEHMDAWEILALGTIPTKRVILSNITRGHFVTAMESDSEIFPYLETLSVMPLTEQSGDDSEGEERNGLIGLEDGRLREILDSVCKIRGVKIRADGYCVKPSTGRYGFA